MKTIIFSIHIILLSIAMVSCQKEESRSAASSSAGDIKGTYDFISLHAKTISTNQSVSGADISKTITLTEYDSQDNTGTIKIDANNLTSTNLGYSTNTIAKASYYENGALIDTFSLPLQFTAPPSNSAGAYKQVTADSLYFPGGTIISGTSQGLASPPSGAKIKMDNNNLMMTFNSSQTSTQTQQGETVTTIAEGTFVITLKKK